MSVLRLLALMTLLLAGVACESTAVPRREHRIGTTLGARDIPVDFHRRLLFVDVWINGHGPFAMILDTGATVVVLDDSVARRLKLARTGDAFFTEGVGTAAIPREAWVATLKSLRLSREEWRDMDVAVTDLSALSDSAGRPLDGVLGYPVFADRTVQIDYPRRTVRYLRPGGFKPVVTAPDRYHSSWMDLPPGAPIPRIHDLTIQHWRYRVILDTGAAGTLWLSQTKMYLHNITINDLPPDERQTQGLFGSAKHRRWTAPDIHLGGIGYDRPEIFFIEEGFEQSGLNSRYLGIAGNGLLEDLVVTFDYLGRRIHFERR